MAKTVLDLNTLVDRPAVKIDGTEYDLANGDELSIVDCHKVGRWGARVAELFHESADVSEADAAELADLLDRLCRLVLRAPREIHDKLTDAHRLRVCRVFTDLQRAEQKSPQVDVAVPATSTGESRSPV